MTTPYSHESTEALRDLLDACISLPYVPLVSSQGHTDQYFVDAAHCPNVEVGVGGHARHTRPLAMGIKIPLMELVRDSRLQECGIGGSDWHISDEVSLSHAIVTVAGQTVAVPLRGQLGAVIRHNKSLVHVTSRPVAWKLDIANAKVALMLPSETGRALVIVPIAMKLRASFDKDDGTLLVSCEKAWVSEPVVDPVKRVKETITDLKVIGFTLDASIDTTNRKRYAVRLKPTVPPNVCYDLEDKIPFNQVRVYASSDPEKANAIMQELQLSGTWLNVYNGDSIKSSFSLECDTTMPLASDTGWLDRAYEFRHLINTLRGLIRISEVATMTLPLPTRPKYGVYNISRDVISNSYASSHDFELTTRGVHYLW